MIYDFLIIVNLRLNFAIHCNIITQIRSLINKVSIVNKQILLHYYTNLRIPSSY